MMKVSDELSASALIRGLDSEERRVTIVELKFKLMDLITIVIGFLTIVSVVIVQNKFRRLIYEQQIKWS